MENTRYVNLNYDQVIYFEDPAVVAWFVRAYGGNNTGHLGTAV